VFSRLLIEHGESFEDASRFAASTFRSADRGAESEESRRRQSRLSRKLDSSEEPAGTKELDTITATIDELKKAIEKDPKDEASKAKLNASVLRGRRPSRAMNRTPPPHHILPDHARPQRPVRERCVLVAGLKTYLATLTEQVARSATSPAHRTGHRIDRGQVRDEYELLKRLALKQGSAGGGFRTASSKA